jgi:hypothetical protein
MVLAMGSRVSSATFTSYHHQEAFKCLMAAPWRSGAETHGMPRAERACAILAPVFAEWEYRHVVLRRLSRLD